LIGFCFYIDFGRQAVSLNKKKPIGIFDSGIGGLTVVREILRQLPDEDLIYLGDTARVPYGSKSKKTVKAFTLQNSLFLLENDVKMIVIACNTASAVALDFVSSMFKVPVIGVVIPGAGGAVGKTKNKKIGVIGTHSTVLSGAYTAAIRALNAEIEVMSKACPLFVPLAEEGWTSHQATQMIIEEYLLVFKSNGIDTLVLGCTHYPILKSAISKYLGQSIQLIDSGVETATMTRSVLTENDLLNDPHSENEHRYYVTDMPEKFQEIGQRFLGRSLDKVEVAKVENVGF